MVARPALLEEVDQALKRSPAVALLGPHQVGKTTLARHFVPPDTPQYLDLEDPVVEARLADPMTLLSGMKGLVVIDEVQRAPELFKTLRVLLDRPDNPVRVLLLGSALPALFKQSSESLSLGIADPITLLLHPRCGASWEGFAVDQILRFAQPDLAWFRATHGGAALDLPLSRVTVAWVWRSSAAMHRD